MPERVTQARALKLARLAPLLVLAALACSSCGTLLGMTVGGIMDRHNMETRVLADSVSTIALGTKLIVRTRDGETIRGTLQEIVREGDVPSAIRLKVAPARSGGQDIVEVATPADPRTIALADIRTLRTRKPGIGNSWVFVVVGALFDAWLLHTLFTADWS
jgi:3D (Asp-Asp-Asp) domain-containing protein